MTDQNMSPSVVLIRHAQSAWNREGRFTGWADPELTELGRNEAMRAGQMLADLGFTFDRAYTSRLTRARETAAIVLNHSGNRQVPIYSDWRLNERHYGALQGEDKTAMVERVGAEQVWRWRRGYLDRPPALAANDPRHPAHDILWRDIDVPKLPNGESLVQTHQRVVDYWQEKIMPQIRNGRRLLISSHGNTLRALLMALDDMNVDQVEAFEIPTAMPIVYSFLPNGEPLGWSYLVDDRRAA